MRVQRLVMPDGSGSWTVLDDRGEVIAPAEAFLAQTRPPMRWRARLRTSGVAESLTSVAGRLHYHVEIRPAVRRAGTGGCADRTPGGRW